MKPNNTKHWTPSKTARRAWKAKWRKRETWMPGFAAATRNNKGRLFR